MARTLSAALTLGGSELARIDDLELDGWVGWLRGRWSPTPTFEEVRELFAAEQALARGRYDAAAWRAIWEEMWGRGVRLVFSDGSAFDRDFAVEVEKDDRTWVTYWGTDTKRASPRASIGPATQPGLVSVVDPEWRQAVEAALDRSGELVCLTMRDAIRRWFLVRTTEDLDRVLTTVSSIAPWGKSDGVSVVATPEFPHRGHDNAQLRKSAKEIASESWVLVACKHEGDPELHDQDVFDDPHDVDEWFSEAHDGTTIVGQDPFERPREPGDEFFAYGVRADGTVLPGSF